jgi:GT2 family glycosyltransferase
MQTHALILNWNNYDDVFEAIESLRASERRFARIWLVDNGSTDGSFERLSDRYAGVAEVSLHANGENFGFSRGVNVGIRLALDQGADAVLLVNNDAVLDAGCLGALEEEIEAESDAGMAAPRIFFHGTPQRVWQGGGYYRRWKSGPVTPDKNRLEPDLPSATLDVTFLTGCIVLIRRDVFEEVGFFSEDFYFYEEDVDFCLRASRAGFRLLYVPRARAWHKIEEVAKDRTSPFVLYHLARSRIVCLRRNFAAPYVMYGALVHLLLFTPFRMLQVARGSRSRAAVGAWFRGTWHGITAALHG